MALLLAQTYPMLFHNGKTVTVCGHQLQEFDGPSNYKKKPYTGDLSLLRPSS